MIHVMTLQEKRKKAGYSQSELSEASGISKRSIQHMEHGDRLPDKAQLETLCKLALTLNCPIDDLLTQDSTKELYSKAKRL